MGPNFYEKWKKNKDKYSKKDKQESGGSEQQELLAPQSDGTVATIRYVNEKGELLDDQGSVYSRGITEEKKKDKGKSKDYGKFGRDYDYSHYRNTYGNIHDDENEIIKGHIPYFDAYDANKFIQNRLIEWLTEMGYKEWKDNKSNPQQKPGGPFQFNKYQKYKPASSDDLMFMKSVVKNYIVNDLFAMYYSPDYDIKELKTESRQKWFDALSQLNNYLLKVISNNNTIYSSIVTFHIIKNIILSQDRDDALGDDAKDKDIDDFLNDMATGKHKVTNGQGKNVTPQPQSLQDALQQAIEDTQEEIDQRETMDEIFGKAKGFGEERERGEIQKLLTINRIDVKVLTKFINGIIKNTKKSTGGAKPKYYEESFLDADAVEEILDLELMAFPEMFDEMMVHDITYTQKFNVYIDFSSSMISTTKIRATDNDSQECIVQNYALAKLIYYKMYCMNLIHEVYGFNSKPYKLTHEGLMREQPSGGTTIENVIKHVENETKIPSLIISDLEDYINTYSKLIFILGIEGTVYNEDDEEFKKYIGNKQIKILNNGYIRGYNEAFA